MAYAPEPRNAGRAGLLAGVVLALAACAPSAPVRPSFVVVLADDLGWADVGFEGSTFHHTPAIDRLAREGLVFTQAYAAAPVCSPTRAAFFTGLAPARLHLTAALGPHAPTGEATDEGGEGGDGDEAGLLAPRVEERVDPSLPTVATALRAAGYRTAWIGKWHLDGDPREHGFEQALGWGKNGAVGSYFAPYHIPTLPEGPPGEYLTDRLSDEAVRFVEECGERPFLLVLSHYAPHLPLQAPAELVARYQERADPAAPQHNPIYAAMIERVDDGVARLRSTLERLGLESTTHLVFTSDNGGFEEKPLERKRKVVGREPSHEVYSITSNLPLRGGKGRLYEGGLRVPLVFWGGPGARTGTCETPVVTMDLAPTILALAGAAPLPVCDGLDLSPLLAGRGALEREALYFHFPHQSFLSAVRRGDEKLVYAWKDAHAELYDLATDPGESHDLAGERAGRVQALEAELFRWLERVGAERPTPH